MPTAFVITLLIFLALAVVLVAVQLLDVVLLRPDLVSGASLAVGPGTQVTWARV